MTITAYQDNRTKPDVFEYVTVKATDFNGTSFDGSPFSSTPKWLQTLEDEGRLRVVQDGQCTDYANWEIKNGDVWEHATPGDRILNENGNISVVKITKHQERIIREEFMEELAKEV